MKYAWIENDAIRDICHGTPTECYTPDIAAHYATEVPDEARNGWVKDGDTWIAPPQPEPQPEPGPEPPQPEKVYPKVYPKVSPVEFKLLFNSAERMAIKAARLTNPILEDAYEILEDIRLKEVDLGIKSNQDLIAYMVTLSLITQERAEQVLNGEAQ
jgi:hypothetical protein